MDYKDYLGWAMTGAQGALITIQSNPTAQKILFYVTLVTAFVNLIYSIQRWYKTSMADKKITSNENRNLIQLLINGGKEILEIFTGNFEINKKPTIADNVVEVDEPKKDLTKPIKIDTIKEGELKNEETIRNQDNDQFID